MEGGPTVDPHTLSCPTPPRCRFPCLSHTHTHVRAQLPDPATVASAISKCFAQKLTTNTQLNVSAQLDETFHPIMLHLRVINPVFNYFFLPWS